MIRSLNKKVTVPFLFHPCWISRRPPHSLRSTERMGWHKMAFYPCNQVQVQFSVSAIYKKKYLEYPDYHFSTSAWISLLWTPNMLQCYNVFELSPIQRSELWIRKSALWLKVALFLSNMPMAQGYVKLWRTPFFIRDMEGMGHVSGVTHWSPYKWKLF